MNNPHNKLITKNQVEDILNSLGNIGENNSRQLVNCLDLYQNAFVSEEYHQSINNYFQKDNLTQVTIDISEEELIFPYISKSSNENLEYLGDGILKGIMRKYIYKRFPMIREGPKSKLQHKIEQCKALHQMAITLGFKEYLLLSLQVENQTILDIQRGRNLPNLYEDAFEAFIGAIEEDLGNEYATRFVINIIEETIDFSEFIYINDNFKESLQQFYQLQNIHEGNDEDNSKKIWNIPKYIQIHKENPIYRQVFTCIIPWTNIQFDFNNITDIQRNNIKIYTDKLRIYYKIENPLIYNELIKHDYILALGTARSFKKGDSSQQECAKIALTVLGLPLDFKKSTTT